MAAVDLQDKENLFRSDDSLVTESKTFSRNGSGVGSCSNGFSPMGSSWSGLSSPFGSELGSTETESEEEDDEFMAQLTRQMADYMLDEDDDENITAVKECGPDISRLNNMKDYPSLENQPLKKNQVKKCKVVEAKVAESTHQPERNKAHKLKNRTAGILGSPPAAWPQLQTPQQVSYGSGMRAVFLGGPGSKNTRTTGTGVFLPRGTSNPQEVRKKIGCSTVLIPARVLHALQLHFQNVNNRSQSDGPPSLKSYPPQPEVNSAQANRQSQPESHSADITTHDIGLPQEWTY